MNTVEPHHTTTCLIRLYDIVVITNREFFEAIYMRYQWKLKRLYRTSPIESLSR